MKTRLLAVFVFVLNLFFVLTWSAIAQGPDDVQLPGEGGAHVPETYSGEMMREEEIELTPPPPPQPERGQRPLLTSDDFGLQATKETERLGAAPLGLGGGGFDVNYFFDGMENGAGSWTTSGLWHIANSGDVYQNAYNGNASWWYGQEATGNYDTAAANSGFIQTGPIAIPSNAPAVWLRFWSWEYTEGSWGHYDTRKVYLSTNGVDWTQIWQSYSDNDKAQWYETLVNLSSEAGKSIYLRFEFDTVDGSNNGYRGWYLDDVAVGYDYIQLSPTAQAGYGLPGEAVGYPWNPPNQMWIQNNIGVATAFTMTATGIWTSSFGSSTGVIEPGQIQYFGGSVQIPADAVPGDYDDTTLVFTSQAMPTLTGEQTMRTWAGWVHHLSHQIIDDGSGNSQGDGDGKIDPGEMIEVAITLKNDLDRTAYRVYAELWDNAGSSWYDVGEYYGDITAGGTADSFGRYRFKAPTQPTLYPGEVITFSLQVFARGVSWSETFTETVDVDSMVYLGPDSSGGGDPGETITYHLTLGNWTGSARNFDLSANGNNWAATLSPASTGSVPYGDLTPLTLSVTIPPAARQGDSDTTIVQAANGTGLFFEDAAVVTTSVLCQNRHVWTDSRSGAGYEYRYLQYSGELFARVYISATTNSKSGLYIRGYDGQSWTTLHSDWLSGTRQVQLAYAPAVYRELRISVEDWEHTGWAYDYVLETCYEPVQLTPAIYNGVGAAGSAVTRTFTLRNNTGVTTSFNLSLDGATWPGTVTPTRTYTLAESEQTTCQVVVNIPHSVSASDWDTVTLRASSVASPTLNGAAALRTTVLNRGWFQTYWDCVNDWYWNSEAYLDSINRFTEWRLTNDRDGQYNTATSAFYIDRVPYVWGRSRYNLYNVQINEVEFGARDVTGAVVISTTRVADYNQATDSVYDQNPAIAVDPVNGNIGLTWSRRDRRDTASPWRNNVYYAIYNRNGGVVQPPTALTGNADDTVQDRYPVIEAYRNGGFVVAWEHYADHTYSVYYVVLNGNGQQAKSPTELTPNTGGWDDYDPRLTQMQDGSIMVVWEGEFHNAETREIAYALLNPDGSVAQGETFLQSDADASIGNQENPDAVALSDGSVVLAWTENGQRYSSVGQIYYAMLSAANDYAVVVSPTLLYNPASNVNWNVSLTEDEEGRAVFTWARGYDGEIYYALVAPDGSVLVEPSIYRKFHYYCGNVNYKGYGNGGMQIRSLFKVYLPLLFKSS